MNSKLTEVLGWQLYVWNSALPNLSKKSKNLINELDELVNIIQRVNYSIQITMTVEMLSVSLLLSTVGTVEMLKYPV